MSKAEEKARIEDLGQALSDAVDALLTPPGAPVRLAVDYPAKVEEVTDPESDETEEVTVYEAGTLNIVVAADV